MSDWERKVEEAVFHDRRERLRHTAPEEFEQMTRNHRFYAVNRASKRFMEKWLREHCTPGRRVLDYCCGGGLNTLFIAECGADVVGIDISAESLRAARVRLKSEGLGDRSLFVVAAAERTAFANGTLTSFSATAFSITSISPLRLRN